MSLLGDKIAYCRKNCQLSQKELAAILSVSPRTLSRYEKGISEPSLFAVYALSIVTDMPMEAFVSEIFSLEAFKEMDQKEFRERYIEIYHNFLNGIF